MHDLHSPGSKPGFAGEYEERQPDGSPVDRPRRVTLASAEGQLPPTQGKGRRWARIGPPAVDAGPGPAPSAPRGREDAPALEPIPTARLAGSDPPPPGDALPMAGERDDEESLIGLDEAEALLSTVNEDWLDPDTRKSRSALLAASVVVILIFLTGLGTFSFLGVSLDLTGLKGWKAAAIQLLAGLAIVALAAEFAAHTQRSLSSWQNRCRFRRERFIVALGRRRRATARTVEDRLRAEREESLAALSDSATARRIERLREARDQLAARTEAADPTAELPEDPSLAEIDDEIARFEQQLEAERRRIESQTSGAYAGRFLDELTRKPGGPPSLRPTEKDEEARYLETVWQTYLSAQENGWSRLRGRGVDLVLPVLAALLAFAAAPFLTFDKGKPSGLGALVESIESESETWRKEVKSWPRDRGPVMLPGEDRPLVWVGYRDSLLTYAFTFAPDAEALDAGAIDVEAADAEACRYRSGVDLTPADEDVLERLVDALPECAGGEQVWFHVVGYASSSTCAAPGADDEKCNLQIANCRAAGVADLIERRGFKVTTREWRYDSAEDNEFDLMARARAFVDRLPPGVYNDKVAQLNRRVEVRLLEVGSCADGEVLRRLAGAY